jgi:lysine 2,3-aminomutase
VEEGLAVIKAIQGHTSGMAVPHYVIDAPGGGGKIPVLPSDYLLELNSRAAVLKNFENRIFQYPQPKPEKVPATTNSNGERFKILNNGGNE